MRRILARWPARGSMPLGIAVLFSVVGGCRPQAPPEGVRPPVAVTVSCPLSDAVYDYVEETGQLAAKESVEIRSRVTGYLDKVAFQEGTEVKQDDLLYQIDPRPLQAEYNRLAAQVTLREASLKYRAAELERSKRLLQQQAIPQADFDQAVAAYDEAAAAVGAAKASSEGAELNLKFATIRAPIAGEISRTGVTPGNLVTADTTLLTNIVSVDPIYAYFNVDERTILNIQDRVRQGKIQGDGSNTVPVLMALANDRGYPRRGVLDFADNKLDTGTGTIRVRGVFANPKPERGDRPLLPGLFVRVRIPLGKPMPTLLLPDRAIGTDQGLKYVMVVGPDNKVEQRRVVTGRLDDGLRSIEEGLKAEDRVIINGVQRVRAGEEVTPQEQPLARTSEKTT